MSNERLEELKGVLESWGAWSDWNESQRKVLKDLACLLERVQELEYASKYNGELNEFLQKRKLPPNTLGRHVVDVVMDYVEELEEENKQIKTTYQDRVDDIESMREMLGLTWEHFQDETGQPIEKLQGDEINRLQEDNQRYKQALEYTQSELEYAHVTGNMNLRNDLIKKSLKAIDKALAGDNYENESKA